MVRPKSAGFLNSNNISTKNHQKEEIKSSQNESIISNNISKDNKKDNLNNIDDRNAFIKSILDENSIDDVITVFFVNVEYGLDRGRVT